jgi:sugar transferase (PEP-CTERM/EpsH1 system associated)
MRVLWVKSGGLLPLDHGGRIRSYQLAKILAQSHAVSLFTFYPPVEEDEHDTLKEIFSRVESVPISIPQQNSAAEYVAYAKNLFSSLPYSVTKYCQRQVSKQLRQHLLEHQYDVVICDFLLTAGVLPWDLPGPRVLFTHNVEAQIWERQFQVARNPIWKVACYREFRTTEKMERKFLKRAEHVLAVSETDKEFFSRFIDPAKVFVVPTGVDIDYFRPSAEPEKPKKIVFTGSMDWLANEDGILYFAEKVLPLIRKEIPEATLDVVGRRPSAKLKRIAAGIPGVTVTGTVADVRPYIGTASVYVVPLLVGGGTRIKIFEAMAMGKAVVSTSIGAEGLPVTHEENILLADDAVGTSRQVIMLLRNPQMRAELGKSARQLVEQNYSWTSVGAQLTKLLEDVVLQYSSSRDKNAVLNKS